LKIYERLPIVSLANAVVHKGAMVVEYEDTLITSTTVRSSRWPKYLTSITEIIIATILIKLILQVPLKVHLGCMFRHLKYCSPRNYSRISHCSCTKASREH